MACTWCRHAGFQGRAALAAVPAATGNGPLSQKAVDSLPGTVVKRRPTGKCPAARASQTSTRWS
jgi:hypothetical protein